MDRQDRSGPEGHPDQGVLEVPALEAGGGKIGLAHLEKGQKKDPRQKKAGGGQGGISDQEHLGRRHQQEPDQIGKGQEEVADRKDADPHEPQQDAGLFNFLQGMLSPVENGKKKDG